MNETLDLKPNVFFKGKGYLNLQRLNYLIISSLIQD